MSIQVHQLIFVAASDGVDELELDENPAESYPCMSTLQFHRDARAQLYALAMGTFVDEAFELEILYRPLTEEGPYIYRLDSDLMNRLADLDEDDIARLTEYWLECEELELMAPEAGDAHDFVFQMVHFCLTARQSDLDIYIYSD